MTPTILGALIIASNFGFICTMSLIKITPLAPSTNMLPAPAEGHPLIASRRHQKRFAKLTSKWASEVEGSSFILLNDLWGESTGHGSQTTVAISLSSDGMTLAWQYADLSLWLELVHTLTYQC